MSSEISPELCDRLVRERMANSPQYCAIFIQQMINLGWVDLDDKWKALSAQELQAAALGIYDGLLVLAAKNHNGLN